MITDLDQQCVNTIRVLSFESVQKANSGHPGLPMGMADVAYVLWHNFLRHNPTNPSWVDRDRFILSAGHGSMLLYSLLHLTGYDLSLEQLQQFRQWGSLTPGHPEVGLTPGVEMTTGPLGQGFATAVGFAIAEAFLAEKFNKPTFKLINHYTYVLVSDGDLMEGISHEAASLAGHMKLGKLIYLYDDNEISIDGHTNLSYTEDRLKRFEAYGWHVQQIDGHNHEAIEQAIKQAQAVTNQPSIIACQTIIGYGSPNKAGSHHVHGAPLGPEEVNATKEHLGWPTDVEFYIPDDVLTHFRSAIEAGTTAEVEWHDRFRAYTAQYPTEATQLQRFLTGELPENWTDSLPLFAADAKGMATRAASGKTLNAIAEILPNLIGGSADLAPSNNTYLSDYPVFANDTFAGRNFHFGVREFGMTAALNGMALHGGVIPYGGTFFVFSDYSRPALRLAALSHIPAIYVFTHDSIGLGEDGPTHQPIEHLIALRAIPNLTVIRPADANETTQAWKVAIEKKDGPTALVLTRQNLPVYDRTVMGDASGTAKGGYLLLEVENPVLILIASGSEVEIMVQAQANLAEQGIAANVVSLPSWELFAQQSQAYRDQVLPPAILARVAIEAGSPLGWAQWVGPYGETIGLEQFGASAPYKTLYNEFGLTVDNVITTSLAVIEKTKRISLPSHQPSPNNKLVFSQDSTKINPALQKLSNLGQSLWYDNIERALLEAGELERLVAEDCVVGVTSNPSIFEKAINNSTAYDAQIWEILETTPNISIKALYETLVITDIQRAADILRPIYNHTAGDDGYVSLEVSPTLAHDTAGTIAEAERLYQALNRPNVMIKIPATQAGLPAITEVIGKGINVNVTLIFSLQTYIDVATAYIAGLEKLAVNKGDISKVASVASFFISRVDALLDTQLAELNQAKATALQGKLAIANAKAAYLAFQEIFSTDRFTLLRQRGARLQRPLWASTSTKNPAYSDVLYIEELIGPDTVNTAPPATIEYFKDHGQARAGLTEELANAPTLLAQATELGIDYEMAMQTLQNDGVKAFLDAFETLLQSLEKKRAAHHIT